MRRARWALLAMAALAVAVLSVGAASALTPTEALKQPPFPPTDVSLLVASISALILLNASGQGDKAQAWISAGYFVAAFLLAALCFWRLF